MARGKDKKTSGFTNNTFNYSNVVRYGEGTIRVEILASSVDHLVNILQYTLSRVRVGKSIKEMARQDTTTVRRRSTTRR